MGIMEKIEWIHVGFLTESYFIIFWYYLDTVLLSWIKQINTDFVYKRFIFQEITKEP